MKNNENKKLLKLCNVLYVGDDADELKTMQAFLSLHVNKTYMQNNPEEGLKSFSYYKPDIVILDLKIFNEANIELLKELKYREQSIILLLTSSSKSDFFIKAIELNADYFLLKPVTDDRLLCTLEKAAILIHSKSRKKYYENFEQKIIDKQSNMIMILDENFQLIKANSRFLKSFEVNSIEEFKEEYKYEDMVLDCRI